MDAKAESRAWSARVRVLQKCAVGALVMVRPRGGVGGSIRTSLVRLPFLEGSLWHCEVANGGVQRCYDVRPVDMRPIEARPVAISEEAD